MKQAFRFIFTFLAMLLISTSNSQEIKVYSNFDEFEPLLQQKNDTTYILNFWATWCKPCVTELPELIEINHKFENQKFKMILVSLDFESQLESKVKPFISERNINAEVVLLADSKQHKWIDRVNKEWSGSIPATVIYNKDFYFFQEKTMTFDELNEIITKNIKQ